jgi:DNA-directed RNA polymerase sigma subunit (sigma70/sigma32)
VEEDSEKIVELKLIVRNFRLIEARKKRGFTQKDLSILTEIPISRIQQIENLRLIPTQETMDEIASALNVPVSHLFPKELLAAIEGGVFDERKARLDSEQVLTLTEAKLVGYQPALVEVEQVADLISLPEELKKVIKTLRRKEEKVIQIRFGLDGGGQRTLEQTAIEATALGFFISNKERARQLEARALKKLRNPFRSRQIKDFAEDD